MSGTAASGTVVGGDPFFCNTDAGGIGRVSANGLTWSTNWVTLPGETNTVEGDLYVDHSHPMWATFWRCNRGRENRVGHLPCAMLACALTWLAETLSGQPLPNVVAWGNYTGPAPGELTNVVVMSYSGLNGLALRADGTVAYWGFNSQLYAPDSLRNVLGVAAGPGYSLVLRSNGTVIPWGWDEVADIYLVPPDLTNAVAIAASDLCFALRSDHTVSRWPTNAMPAPPGLTDAVAVAAGQSFALALRSDGTVVVWGDNTYGQTNAPPGLGDVVSIAAGTTFSMALKGDGTVVVWGDNTYGQADVPPTLTNAVAIAAGWFHCLALRSDGTVAAWGSGPLNYGQTNVPAGLTNVVSIAAGSYSSMAVTGAAMPPRQVLATNVAFGAGAFSAQVPTDRGRLYALEYKNSVLDAQWTLLPLVAGTGGVVTLSDAAPGPGQRFYRVRRW